MKEILKACTCGQDLTIEDMNYLGEQMTFDGGSIDLYNCKFCGTTLVLKEQPNDDKNL